MNAYPMTAIEIQAAVAARYYAEAVRKRCLPLKEIKAARDRHAWALGALGHMQILRAFGVPYRITYPLETQGEELDEACS